MKLKGFLYSWFFLLIWMEKQFTQDDFNEPHGLVFCKD